MHDGTNPLEDALNEKDDDDDDQAAAQQEEEEAQQMAAREAADEVADANEESASPEPSTLSESTESSPASADASASSQSREHERDEGGAPWGLDGPLLRVCRSVMSGRSAYDRLRKELARLHKSPVDYITAAPLDSDILVWWYAIQGPVGSVYEGGVYLGKLTFPPQYPFKPPSIQMHTPSGRFKPDTRLCLSMSDYHPETWNPLWSVSSILSGLLSFMLESTPTQGSVETDDHTKRELARRSREFNRRNPVFKKLFPQLVDDPPAAAASAQSAQSASAIPAAAAAATAPPTSAASAAAAADHATAAAKEGAPAASAAPVAAAAAAAPSSSKVVRVLGLRIREDQLFDYALGAVVVLSAVFGAIFVWQNGKPNAQP